MLAGVSGLVIALCSQAGASDLSGVSITSLSTGSLSVSWTIPAVSTPTVVLSTNAFSTVLSSGVGALAQSSTSFPALSPNTTYWFEVKNSSEPDSDYVTFSTSTLAAAPGLAAYSGVTTAALQANWTTGGNASPLSYEAVRSTGPSPSTNGFFGNQSSATLNTFVLFSGLSLNATYFVEVRAINNNSVPGAYASLASTATLPNAPTSLGPSAVGADQLTINWGDNSNPGGTLYRALISDDAGFLALRGSSITANPFAIFTGLSPNTTYFARVQAVNGFGGSSSFVGLPSTSTLAALPSTAAYTGVTAAALQANWNTSNGPTAVYQAILSSGASPSTNGFFGNQISTTTDVFAVFASLSANTTYFVEVNATNNNSVPTAYASFPSTATLPNAPSSAAPTGAAASQLTANWGINSNPTGTLYFAQISVEASFASVAGSSRTANNFAAFTGLVPNTTYFTQVQAISFSGGATAYTGLPSTSTLAAAPGAAPYSGATNAALQANWTENSNGPTASYQAVLSTGASPGTNGFSGNQTASTPGTSATFASLAVNTTYFVDVRAINNNGVGTAYTSLGSTATLANTPTLLGPSGVTQTELTANWGSNSSPTGTRYLAQVSAASGFTTLAGSSQTANTFASFSGLSPNTTYFMQVQSVNSYGGGSAFAALGSTSTLAVAPAGAAFSAVSVSSMQANWTGSGNGATARYRAVISSGASPSANGFSGNQSSVTYNTSAVFSGLVLTTTYFVEVQAINNNGLSTAFASLGSTLTLSSVQTAAPGQAQTIILNAAGGPIRIDIAEGTFGSAVSVSAKVPASFPVETAGLQGLGVGVEITLTPAVQPIGAATLSIGYPSPLPSGFAEDRLIIARYDENRGVWVPLVSQVDPAGAKIEARVTHFSQFQVMQAGIQSGLSAVRIFPNPFRPSQGAASVTFANLPIASRLRLFTYRGRLLRELAANDTGMVSWDGKDDVGAAVASGVYIVLIEGGGEKKTFKVGIER